MKFYEFSADFDYEAGENVKSLKDFEELEKEIYGWCPIYGRQHPAIKKKEDEEDILTVNLPSSNIFNLDFIPIYGVGVIINDKVANLFSKHGLKGYELKPVRINKIKRMRKPLSSVPKLWEFIVTGFCGMVPPQMGIKMIFKCNACNYIGYSTWSNRSTFIELDQWDGSDFFRVYPMGYVFITERVKKIVEENHLKGCSIVPLEKINIVGDGFGGGRDLSYKPYGKTFGEPLGIYVPLEELLKRVIQLGENDIWPPGLGNEQRKNEWDKEWRNFLYDYDENPGGILSKEILLEKLESMLKKYTHPQAIKDIKEKIDEIKKIKF